MQQRQPAQALDTLLTDVLKWKAADVPDGLLQMLIKSCMNLTQLDKITQIMDKADVGSPVIFAYIEAL